MKEAALVLAILSVCVFWTAFQEKRNLNPRDSGLMAVIAAVMMAGAGAAIALPLVWA